MKAALKGCDVIINSFIVGLGGRDVTPETIITALDKTMKEKSEVKEWLMK